MDVDAKTLVRCLIMFMVVVAATGPIDAAELDNV